MAAADRPYQSNCICQLLEQELQMILGNEQHSHTLGQNIALAARTSGPSEKHHHSHTPGETCDNCGHPGHSTRYCVCGPNGGMKGKSVADARAAQKADMDAEKSKLSSLQAKPSASLKVPYIFKDSHGKALYTIEVDLSAIPALDSVTPHTKFAGLASFDPSAPSELLMLTNIEDIEYEGFAAIAEEEHKTSFDWNLFTDNSINDATFIATPFPFSPSYTQIPTINLDGSPFHLDTGATGGVTPEKSDFMTLLLDTCKLAHFLFSISFIVMLLII